MALPTAAPPTWHAVTAAGVLGSLRSAVGGLTAAEAAARLAEHGPNRLPPPERRGPWRRFLAQFRNLLIYVLVACGAGHGGDRGMGGRGGHRRRGGAQRARRLRPGRQGGSGPGRRSATCCRPRPRWCAMAAAWPSPPRGWCPATSSSCSQAIACRRTCAWSRSPACAATRRRSPANRCRPRRILHRSRKRPTSATAAPWPTPARWSRPARPSARWSPPASRPRSAVSAVCSRACRRSTPRSPRKLDGFARQLTIAILGLAAAVLLFGTLVRDYCRARCSWPPSASRWRPSPRACRRS